MVDTPERTTGRLNFKGDIRSRVTARGYDTPHGFMIPESIEYNEERDLTTIEFVHFRDYLKGEE